MNEVSSRSHVAVSIIVRSQVEKNELLRINIFDIAGIEPQLMNDLDSLSINQSLLTFSIDYFIGFEKRV